MNDFLTTISQSLNTILIGLDYFIPELVLIAAFIVAILSDLFFSKKNPQLVFLISLGAILLSGFLSFKQFELLVQPQVTLFNNMIVLDKLAIYFKLILSVVGILFLLFIKSNKQLQNHTKGTGDLYCIILAVQLGMHLMAMSSNLLMIYIAIEMVSVGSYVMVGYISGNNKQAEASMKYALFGGVCSAIMLYGMSLAYAFTGTLNLLDENFIYGLLEVSSLSSGVAILLILIGIGFKLSFAPLHFWSPDVYEGAPTPITAFLSTGPKIAGFAILIRFLFAFQQKSSELEFSDFNFNLLLGIIAFITMIVGNFSALWQDNVKRMLAYSSIGHTGFILMAVIAFSQTGFNALLFYLFMYAIMNMAAFMLADTIEAQTGIEKISEYKGLGKYLKLEFICFVVVLIALTGLPPSGGFIAKFLVFSSAAESYISTGSLWMMILMITGAITTLVSLFYYFKIPLNAFLRNADIIFVKSPGYLRYIVVVMTVILVLFGIFPSIITDFIK